MQLKLKELQRVAKETMKEEKFRNALREEFFRLFGPPVMVSKKCEKVAEAVDEHLDFLEAVAQEVPRDQISTPLFVEAATCNSAVIRRVAARLLPERYTIKLLSDPSSSVRHAAAKRLPYNIVKEAVKRYPDDQMIMIAKAKRLAEAGLPKPKEATEPFDIYGDEPLGNAVKQHPGVGLSDEWYERLASKLCKEYGSNLEGQWEEVLATRVAASHYATSGVKLDRDKLLKSIYACLKDRDDAVLGETSLKSIAKSLLESASLDDEMLPVVEEIEDPLAKLIEVDHSSAQYVKIAEQIFDIKKSVVPAGIKKYRIGEGHKVETHIPVKGKVPGGRITSSVEKVLDNYVGHWNNQQSLKGEPYRMNWFPNPTDAGFVGFHVELK